MNRNRNKIFQCHLAELRERAGFSRRQVADMLDLQHDTKISLAESGFGCRLSLALRLAQIFGKPVESMWQELPAPPKHFADRAGENWAPPRVVLFMTRLEDLRQGRGLTIRQVATMLNIHCVTIYRAECGADINLRTAIKLSHFYNAPVESIWWFLVRPRRRILSRRK